jgi:hypothetical protein
MGRYGERLVNPPVTCSSSVVDLLDRHRSHVFRRGWAAMELSRYDDMGGGALKTGRALLSESFPPVI